MTTHRPTTDQDATTPVGPESVKKLAPSGARSGDHTHLSIAKREREGASQLLAELVDDRNTSERDYALIGLAAYGDARAWDSVLARLKTVTARPSDGYLDFSPMTTAVVYLLRHMGSDAGRAEAVRSLLWKRWARFPAADRAWLKRYWPTIGDPVEWSRVNPALAHAWLLQEPILSASSL